MDYDNKITEDLNKIIQFQKKQIELLEKIYLLFSKYDDQYLIELEKENVNFQSG